MDVKPRHTTGWFVPVHSVGDIATPQIGRLPDGCRVGIAFTTLASLRRASGAGQEWMRLTEEALRETLAPLGVPRIQLDPELVTPDHVTPEPVTPEPVGRELVGSGLVGSGTVDSALQPSYPAQPAFVH